MVLSDALAVQSQRYQGQRFQVPRLFWDLKKNIWGPKKCFEILKIIWGLKNCIGISKNGLHC